MPSVALEIQLKGIAPTVNFAHTYYGLCISESKMFSFPVPLICNRPLGKLCLAHFYPHRCGGVNPLTMLRDYRKQSARLEAMRSTRAIVTASEHMRRELLRHGFAPDRVRTIGLPVSDSTITYPSRQSDYSSGRPAHKERDRSLPSRVIFVGRMEKPKGASLLIEAMVIAAEALKRPLSLTVAGDGRERRALEDQARKLACRNSSLDVVFTGWLDREQLCAAMDQSDLLAVPSLWPEPFGLVGVEAGTRGLPAVAFDAGGIGEWLQDGVNGRLVRSRPPTAQALALALADCLDDPAKYAGLSQDARRLALRFSPRTHLEKLLTVLRDAARSAP
jgi:glycosyltransferase involved in cell wall biosynthesis